jgi:predicted O-methyltransferase YrrM
MSTDDVSIAYAEAFLPEDPPLRAARARAEELGVSPVSAATGAALRFLAAAVGARSVVEIGTGTGVSGTWLMRGMRADGTLTTIDVEAEHQGLARKTFADAGVGTGSRHRLIAGRALDVLPRLTDGAYDLVFCDADRRESTDYLSQSLRLLRAGGVVAFAGALAGGRVSDPGSRDPETVAARELATAVRDDVRLTPVLLPNGDGLLVAVVAKSSPVG